MKKNCLSLDGQGRDQEETCVAIMCETSIGRPITAAPQNFAPTSYFAVTVAAPPKPRRAQTSADPMRGAMSQARTDGNAARIAASPLAIRAFEWANASYSNPSTSGSTIRSAACFQAGEHMLLRNREALTNHVK